MEQRTLKNANNWWKSNIYFYLETSGCQSLNLYLNVVNFFNTVLIRHLWQLNTLFLALVSNHRAILCVSNVCCSIVTSSLFVQALSMLQNLA